jgi:hypothetical protein
MPIVCMREMKPHDLTIFLTAREGCLAWNPDVETFAKKTRRLMEDAHLVLLYAPAKQLIAESDPRIS